MELEPCSPRCDGGAIAWVQTVGSMVQTDEYGWRLTVHQFGLRSGGQVLHKLGPISHKSFSDNGTGVVSCWWHHSGNRVNEHTNRILIFAKPVNSVRKHLSMT